MKGKLIVIEGLDGSGKTTQMDLLCKRLTDEGKNTVRIKLPDYESPSSSLVRMYLGGEFGSDPGAVNAYAASSFYAVDRVANYINKWKDDYLGGKLILADRYTTSNAYHQTLKLDRSEWDGYLEWLEDYEYNKLGIPRPDGVIYLDMPIEISQKLMTARYGGDEVKKDIHEANVAYLKRCREAAVYAAGKLGWHVIPCADGDTALPIQKIAETVYEKVSACLTD
ncbi:MAG: deoxynucleoside kinase [Clostridiales bacterium]|nr:deoxynucleoside kinase [Clostridiales bacterium]